MLMIWGIWFCRALVPYQLEVSQYNIKRDSATSKYHPDLSVSILNVKVIQGHEVKEGQSENFKFGRCDTCC